MYHKLQYVTLFHASAHANATNRLNQHAKLTLEVKGQGQVNIRGQGVKGDLFFNTICEDSWGNTEFRAAINDHYSICLVKGRGRKWRGSCMEAVRRDEGNHLLR